LTQQYADIYLLQSHSCLCSDFAVNECLRIVASSWTFLLTVCMKFRFFMELLP